MAKYYQHIDPNEPDVFQTVTKLLYIDDDDQEMVVYNFEDGTKYGAAFIASISDNPEVSNKKMIEIEFPSAVWKFNKKVVNMNNQKITSEQDGQQYEIPDPYFVDRNGAKNIKLSSESELGFGTGLVTDGVRYDIIPPRKMGIKIEDESHYYSSYIKYALQNNITLEKDIYTDFLKTSRLPQSYNTSVQKELGNNSFNFNDFKQTTKSVQTPKEVVTSVNTNKTSNTNPFNETKKQLVINADEIIASNDYDIVSITYQGNNYTLDINKFFKQSVTEEHVLTTKPTADIVIDNISEQQLELVDNMINMSKTEEAHIDMELLLLLPPADVYNIIKTVYPDGMADAFVKNIANRMSAEELKLAVAKGLLSFYNGEIAEKDKNKNKNILSEITE